MTNPKPVRKIYLLIQFWLSSFFGQESPSILRAVELQTRSLGATAFLFAWAAQNLLKVEEYV